MAMMPGDRYVIQLHIPLPEAGYISLDSQRSHSLRSTEQITNQFKFMDAEEEALPATRARSQLRLSLGENYGFVLIASRISNRLTDGFGRSGIVHGLYFRCDSRQVNFSWSEVRDFVDAFFEFLEDAHESVGKDYRASLAVQDRVSNLKALAGARAEELAFILRRGSNQAKVAGGFDAADPRGSANLCIHLYRDPKFRELIGDVARKEVDRYVENNDSGVLIRLLRRVFGGRAE